MSCELLDIIFQNAKIFCQFSQISVIDNINCYVNCLFDEDSIRCYRIFKMFLNRYHSSHLLTCCSRLYLCWAGLRSAAEQSGWLMKYYPRYLHNTTTATTLQHYNNSNITTTTATTLQQHGSSGHHPDTIVLCCIVHVENNSNMTIRCKVHETSRCWLGAISIILSPIFSCEVNNFSLFPFGPLVHKLSAPVGELALITWKHYHN